METEIKINIRPVVVARVWIIGETMSSSGVA